MVFFFFEQKTAYEMRISDWSSDVCSSDLSYRRIACLRHDCASRSTSHAWGSSAGLLLGDRAADAGASVNKPPSATAKTRRSKVVMIIAGAALLPTPGRRGARRA